VKEKKNQIGKPNIQKNRRSRAQTKKNNAQKFFCSSYQKNIFLNTNQRVNVFLKPSKIEKNTFYAQKIIHKKINKPGAQFQETKKISKHKIISQ